MTLDPMQSPADDDLFAWAERQVAQHATRDVSSGCLVWTGPLSNGYPAARYGRVSVRITRALLRLPREKGKPVRGRLVACHRCDNPRCVERSHLFVGTDAINAADRDGKGRHRSFNSWADKGGVCRNGHVITEETTVVQTENGRTRRRCRLCLRKKAREWARRHAKAGAS